MNDDESTKLVLRAIMNSEIAFSKMLLSVRADISDLRSLVSEVAAKSGIDVKPIDERIRLLREQSENRLSEFPPPAVDNPDDPAYGDDDPI